MKRSERDLYHGAALARIVEGTGFRSIRKASPHAGHYELNGSRRILMRHSAAESEPWRFIFREEELAVLREDGTAAERAFLCLVCRDELVCVLTVSQIPAVIDLTAETSQSIRVYSRRGSSIEVRGSAGHLDRKIPKHAFPARLFYDGRNGRARNLYEMS